MSMMDPTVFIVDDDPDMRNALILFARVLKVQVEAYETASEFLDLHDLSWRGCLIVDLHLPGMTGLELLEELASKGSTLPTIVITGDGDEARRTQLLDKGVFAYFEKPFHPADLRESLRQAMELSTGNSSAENKT